MKLRTLVLVWLVCLVGAIATTWSGGLIVPAGNAPGFLELFR